jgi:hypothetical protein
MRKAIAALLLVTTITTAAAEPFAQMGPGSVINCAKFNEVSKYPELEGLVFAWTQGYMSGLNDALQDTIGKFRDLRTYAIDQQKLILRDYCFKHPAAKYLDAVNDLMSDLTIVQSTLPNAPQYPLRQRR